MRKKITEMLPVSMFSMSPAILSILMISQPTIPMIFQNITNLLILTRIPLPYRVPVTDQKEYVSRLNSAYTGYTYLTIQPESVILAPAYKMLKILLAVVATFLAAAVIGFLQAFPLCSKTGETPEAHYPAYGTGHSRPGKSHFLSGFPSMNWKNCIRHSS